MRTCHDKNIQSNIPCRYVVRKQPNNLVSLAKWLSVRLRFKWLWVRVQLESLKLQILCLLRARSSLTFRQLWSVDSLGNASVTWQEHTVKWTMQVSTQNRVQSFGQFGPNGLVFVYELSGSGFEFSCSHLNLRFCACLEQAVAWHSGNYRLWIHSQMRTWHDKNIQ